MAFLHIQLPLYACTHCIYGRNGVFDSLICIYIYIWMGKKVMSCTLSVKIDWLKTTDIVVKYQLTPTIKHTSEGKKKHTYKG